MARDPGDAGTEVRRILDSPARDRPPPPLPRRVSPFPVDFAPPCPLAPALAERIRAAREELTHRWLERISARVALDARHVFPTDDLLDHVPLLIDGIAAYLEHPAQEVAADAPVIGKAMELGALRHDQGFDEYQILKEFELLGGIIFAH